MITVTMPMFANSLKLLHLHRTGRAKPVGPAKANDTLQWVRTDWSKSYNCKVVKIGLILREDVKL